MVRCRGYSLDPLLKRFGILRGSITLGLIWGIWHLALSFMPQTAHAKMEFQFVGSWSFLLAGLGLAKTLRGVAFIPKTTSS